MQAQYQSNFGRFTHVTRMASILGCWIAIIASNEAFLRAEELPDETTRKRITSQLIQSAKTQGDVMRGMKVFTNAKSACFSCHKIGSAGSEIGPDLTEIAKKRTLDELAESLLWPNVKIAPDYLPTKVLLDDGTTVVGYVIEKDSSASTLALKDPPTGAVRLIPRDTIENQASSLSLMPNGLVQSLAADKQADLFRFLMDLGTNPTLDTLQIENAIKNASHHEAATFAFDRKPLKPEQRPDWQANVNRARQYDFYTKQAMHFKTQPESIELLQAFAGLDGPDFGHWGNQNEAYWRGNEWNEAAPNLVQCNVLSLPNKTIARAVCFRFGENLSLSACFNSATLEYEALWKGGFIRFSETRHGFIDALRIAGEEFDRPEGTGPAASVLGLNQSEKPKYRGYHVFGDSVVFEYQIGQKSFSDFLEVNSGKVIRRIVPSEQYPNPNLWKGGPSQWPQRLETEIRFGATNGYAIDTIALPTANPWNATISCGDHGFLSDGTAIVATMQGDVFRVEGVNLQQNQTTGKATWRRIAAGLHHALGVCVHDDQIYVLGRNQITRLIDRNGDDETDWYECFSDAFETSPNGHDYICGLERDAKGNFYVASGNQGIVQISPDGSTATVIATGFRNPDGLGLLPDGSVTVPSSEGEWTPSSMISLVTPTIPGARQPFYKTGPTPFFGYRGPKPNQSTELPLVYLPRGVDNSSGGQGWVSDPRMGPIQNQVVHTSYGSATAMVLLRDKVGSTHQGGVFVLPGEFKSGVHRVKTNPKDGQLYFSGMHGWGTYSTDAGCFQRLRLTNKDVQVPVGFHVHANGVRVDFSQPLSVDVANKAKNHFAQCWNYRYSPGYGSKEYSVFNVPSIGHDRLGIASSHVVNGGKSLFIEIPSIQLCNQLHLHLMTQDNEWSDLFLTVHAMDEPYLEIPNPISLVGKIELPHPMKRDLEWLKKSVPNPWRKELKNAREVIIDARDNLQFSQRSFEAKPGEILKLTFQNPDVVPHNWALIRPGSLEKIGQLTNALVNDPDAFVNQYVPKSDDVVCYTDVVEPKGKFTIFFEVPNQTGRYPYLCTFPGHWMVMNGELVVKE